jgi:mono/diheme cytochrome c family protein
MIPMKPIVFMILLLFLAACASDTPTKTEIETAVSTPIPAPTATPTPDPAVLGSEAFTSTCAACHGSNAEGYANELNAPALTAAEHASEHPDQLIHDWIVNGKLGLGRQMPPQGENLTDEEVHAVIAYLQTLWTEEQLVVQQDITSRWPATPEPTWTPSP